MTQSPCESFINLIVRATDREISEPDEQRLNLHVAACAACRGALAGQRAVRAALAARPVADASAGFEARVMTALRAEAPLTERWNWRGWTWRLVPVAAVFAILAVGVVTRQGAASSITTATTPGLDVSSLASPSGQAPVASALYSSSVSDASLLSLMLTAKADDPLAAHLKDKQP